VNINDSFPSKYIKAPDLNGQARLLTMDRVVEEEVVKDEDPKPVLYFRGATKGLVLNKTNAQTISGIYGPETDTWAAQPIELYPDTTNFQGQIVDCTRVRKHIPAASSNDTGEEGVTQEAPF